MDINLNALFYTFLTIIGIFLVTSFIFTFPELAWKILMFGLLLTTTYLLYQAFKFSDEAKNLKKTDD